MRKFYELQTQISVVSEDVSKIIGDIDIRLDKIEQWQQLIKEYDVIMSKSEAELAESIRTLESQNAELEAIIANQRDAINCGVKTISDLNTELNKYKRMMKEIESRFSKGGGLSMLSKETYTRLHEDIFGKKE